MRTTSLALVAAVLSSAYAVSIPGLPACAGSCVTSFGSCSTLDVKCICSDSSLLTNLACCVSIVCSPADQNATIQFADSLCAGQGVTNLPTSASCAPGVPTTYTSGATAAASGSASTVSVPASVSSALASASSAASSASTSVVAEQSSAAASVSSAQVSASASNAAAASSAAASSEAKANSVEGMGLGLVVAGILAAL